MQIKQIYDIVSNRDWYNFRIREYKGKWDIGPTINIKLYKKASRCMDVINEIKNGFKYWYNNITGEWKHHKGITVSCFYED